MIKAFCDCCGKQITDMAEIGNFKIQEKIFAFMKHQKQDQVRGQEYLFCIDCAKKIRDYFQALKRGEDIANSAK